MRLHSGEKPFQCKLCPAKFTQFVHLKLHKRLHTNERPYECPKCSRKYISASGLKTHWKTSNCLPADSNVDLAIIDSDQELDSSLDAMDTMEATSAYYDYMARLHGDDGVHGDEQHRSDGDESHTNDGDDDDLHDDRDSNHEQSHPTFSPQHHCENSPETSQICTQEEDEEDIEVSNITDDIDLSVCWQNCWTITMLVNCIPI